jgi:hypothetical protein
MRLSLTGRPEFVDKIWNGAFTKLDRSLTERAKVLNRRPEIRCSGCPIPNNAGRAAEQRQGIEMRIGHRIV